MLEQGTPMRAIQPLRIALSKIRPNSESLTPLDADYLQVCLLAKDYRAALPVLAEEMLAIAHPEDYNFKTKDFLRYFYYGGMIFVGVKQYAKAVDFFRLVSPSFLFLLFGAKLFQILFSLAPLFDFYFILSSLFYYSVRMCKILIQLRALPHLLSF